MGIVQLLLPAVRDPRVLHWRGLFRGGLVVDQIVVLLDYQNVHHGARNCFHEQWEPGFRGQVDPLKLALRLAADSPYDRELRQVRVYRGLPGSKKDPRGYGAARRQNGGWIKDPRVKLFTRPLRYPVGWPTSHQPGEAPQEKGIDVALAIDFAMMAHDRLYDVGIVMSTDTDLKPALEVVAERGRARAEVAAWSAEDMHNRRLSINGHRLWCHWLDKTNYNSVSDDTDYSNSAQ